MTAAHSIACSETTAPPDANATQRQATVASSYVRELAPKERVIASASAATWLVRALMEAGVDTFFGVPGGPVSPVFDAILTTPGAVLVESRHEANAAMSAIGYYRATGKVPVVAVTAGPGATNVITGVASAHLERVPMVVICGDVAWAASGGKLLQDSGPEGVPIEEMLGRLVRLRTRVALPRSASTQVLAALAAATDPRRPGPALIMVPIDRGAQDAPRLEVVQSNVSITNTISRESVRAAARALADAERPLLVLGAGARNAADDVRRLVDTLDVPFLTTPQAKGLVSEEHPRSLRNGGLAASLWARRYTQTGVDAALVLGSDLDDCAVGATPPIAAGGRLFHVDFDATVFNRNYVTEVGIVADVGAFARELYGVVSDEGIRAGRPAAQFRALRAGSPHDVEHFEDDDAPVIAPHRALADLQRAAGSRATFVTDIGEHMLFGLHYLTARSPGSFVIHLALGSMASGISSAIGLALGDRTRRVVCVCGDGGMQMAGSELLVAMKMRLPIVYAVMNDARYNMVYHGYRQVFGREAPWDSPMIDFVSWARALGMPGVRINRPGEITPELLDSLTSAGMPVVLDIRHDANIRVRGAGRNEALRHMSMPVREEGAR